MAGFDNKILLFLGLVSLAYGSRVVKLSYEEVDGDQASADGLPAPVLEVLTWLNAQRSQPGVKVKSFSWNNCGKPSKIVQVKDIAITPDPVKEGSTAQFSISGNLTANIAAPIPVDVLLEIKYMGIWHTIPCRQGVGSCSYPDVCIKLPPNTCPLKKGPFGMKKSMMVPTGPPEATYRMTMNMKSAQAWVACIQILVDLVN